LSLQFCSVMRKGSMSFWNFWKVTSLQVTAKIHEWSNGLVKHVLCPLLLAKMSLLTNNKRAYLLVLYQCSIETELSVTNRFYPTDSNQPILTNSLVFFWIFKIILLSILNWFYLATCLLKSTINMCDFKHKYLILHSLIPFIF